MIDTLYFITDDAEEDESDMIFSMLTGAPPPIHPFDSADSSDDAGQPPLKSILKKGSLDDSFSSQRSGKSQSVSFDTVEIREHQMILDDSVPGPAALTIAWEAADTDVTTVLDYECSCNRTSFTNKQARALSAMERAAILMNAGYRLQELKFRSPDIVKEVMKRDKRSVFHKNNKPSVYYRVKKAAKKLVGGAPRAA